MLDEILNFLKALFSLWRSIPDETKESILKNAGEAFDPLFRQFYHSEKNGETA